MLPEKIRQLDVAIDTDRPTGGRTAEQVAPSVMVRNGNGHLKNFGALHSGLGDVRLAPMFDVVTWPMRPAGPPGADDKKRGPARLKPPHSGTMMEP